MCENNFKLTQTIIFKIGKVFVELDKEKLVNCGKNISC